MADDLLDLDAYVRRIGWTGPRAADVATLRGVHRAHHAAIPFENLDPVRGVVPSLALPDLQDKMVLGGRGGYCYEHNTLLAAALRALGFGVTLLTARVVVGADRIETRPRTHMALLAEVPGEPRPYLADVGFGAAGSLVEPIPLVEGEELAAGGRLHRLVQVPYAGPLPQWVLQAHGPDGWAGQYAFTVEPFHHPDFEMINWNTATNPRSPFSSGVYVQRTGDGVHRSLAGGQLTVTHADGRVEKRDLVEGELRQVLRDEFGLEAPDGLPA